MRFLRYEDLSEKGIRYSKAQLWRKIKLPDDDPRKFPDPVKGLGSENAWSEVEIDRYIAGRTAAASQREAETTEHQANEAA
jgi:predicted DNA-binding transcriptional regulator AlpA